MKYFLIPCMSFVIMSYFIYHGIYGRRGILRLNEINQEYAQANKEYDDLQNQVNTLRLKVDAMANQSRDLIEEELMRVLNMGNPDDVIVLDSSN